MAIYVTGDTHGDFSRFYGEPFRRQVREGDFVIITGDFGGYYGGGPGEDAAVDQLAALPCTTLFVTGNHENFTRLNTFPREIWHGGTVIRVRPSVLGLTRGQLFDLEGYRFFTMGGAGSRNVEKLDPASPLYRLRRSRLERLGRPFWVRGVDWWEEELPSPAEYETARSTLDRCGWRADFIVTHCAPRSIEDSLPGMEDARRLGSYLPTALSDFLEELSRRARFRMWFMGHYHVNLTVGEQYLILYDEIVRLGE